VRDLLVTPYVSAEENQLRLTARVRDSDPDLRRQPLLDQLRTDLDAALALPAGSLAVNGVTVLYSNMLRSLYRSQILTIGITFLILLVMFLVLFRSFKLSLIVLFPNLIASLSVLAIIGLAGLPLDLMTITIASISIGIAVDGTIHYLCRFRQEFAANGRYLAAMRACHDTVGRAMSLTSITIILGFSILTLSKFVPTVLFGALTGVAMVMAWLGALGLMPWIILRLRPFGPEPAAHGQGPSSAPHDAAR